MWPTDMVSDEFIAEKFKHDYTEQFHILVRMHLSFLLDLNTDNNECLTEKGKLKKWNLVPFVKKTKPRNVTEGAPLTQESISQVYQLIEFLKKEENIKTEGIFRKTGSVERQQELKTLLSQGTTLQLEEGTYSVHDCASVLKSFLAELSDPLLTEAHFPAYCQIAESCGIVRQSAQENKLLEALQLILLLLPTENKVFLKDILDLLHLTASFESNNRMSPDNLAKLFTPHLLCPRKLPLENLLKDSQTLFGIVSFMIKRTPDLFKIPAKLIVDFKARYETKKILSPTKRLNESISDAANTVFTFVDQERTAKENESNPTETALAQLYAHIQSLPESSKKRKYIKQFNKENGHGTPLQVIRSGVASSKNKSFGDSIKRHIFQKKLARKKGLLMMRSSSDEILNSPTQHSPSIVTKARLFCHNCDSSTDVSTEDSPSKKAISNVPKEIIKDSKRCRSEPDLSMDEENNSCKVYITSTPACLSVRACTDVIFTPEGDRKSMSPITRSTQRMTRAMQETMMTPRSRKPVVVLSGTNINTLNKASHSNCVMDKMEELSENSTEENSLQQIQNMKKSKSDGDICETKSAKIPKLNKSETLTSSITNTFKEYLYSRQMETLSPVDSSFSSRTDDFNSTDFNNLSSSKLTDSLLYCLDGNDPDNFDAKGKNTEKELVLKPKQFDENGKPIIFETSF
ncbi:hypothetical protein NQ315_005277 [Exocentrus adspersus]|uniref:Rho-GAP domain-containing protein n=1 Tax=Exocentrus adspersus TaxID=1586481 RepID=A0AAV8W3B2_9CUCU|nr:hypothetical protein NQ315_005277 [Exocentrus adspersus]